MERTVEVQLVMNDSITTEEGITFLAVQPFTVRMTEEQHRRMRVTVPIPAYIDPDVEGP